MGIDLNGDGVIGNIVLKKHGGTDSSHGGNSQNAEQLKTYELMSGGYVLSKGDYQINSAMENVEHDYHSKIIGPGLLLQRESREISHCLIIKMILFQLFQKRIEHG